jgi:DNA polymerase-3 subunit gamma/tau
VGQLEKPAKLPRKKVAPTGDAPPVAMSFHKEVKVLTKPTGNLKGSYLSIKESQDKLRQEGSEKIESNDGKPKNDFSKDELIIAWKKFAYQCKQEGMDTLYASLSARDPKLNKETLVVTHEVDNTIQKSFLETNETKLATFLRNELQNWGIKIQFEDVKGEEVKQLYSGKEKFEDMAKRNPHLLTLQKRFKLDIDF